MLNLSVPFIGPDSNDWACVSIESGPIEIIANPASSE